MLLQNASFTKQKYLCKGRLLVSSLSIGLRNFLVLGSKMWMFLLI